MTFVAKLTKCLSWVWRRFLDLLNIPLWLMAKLVPKSDRVWVFGAWAGDNFSDNPKWLLNYVRRELPRIRPIWLTRQRKLAKLINDMGIECYYAYSFKGYYWSAKAKVGIVCVGLSDINRYITPPILVNTWHGTPIKKVLEDFSGSKLAKTSLQRLSPFSEDPHRYALVTTGSEPEAEVMKRSFGEKAVAVTGHPRNDALINNDIKASGFITQQESHKKILYPPTHRMEGRDKIFTELVFQFMSLQTLLDDMDAFLLIKLHYYHRDEARELSSQVTADSRVKILLDEQTHGDVYPLLAQTDILITDYSSVYVDFLLTEKPIIFYCFDLTDYTQRERGFNFNYLEVTPGPKCFSFDEVSYWVSTFLQDETPYLEDRRRLKNTFHKWQDGQNSRRVTSKILETLEAL